MGVRHCDNYHLRINQWTVWDILYAQNNIAATTNVMGCLNTHNTQPVKIITAYCNFWHPKICYSKFSYRPILTIYT